MDLHFLKDLTAHTGPFATVYLDASHDTEDAAHQAALRWGAARGELDAHGADGATLDALARSVEEGTPAPGPAGRVLVAAGGEVLLDRMLPNPPEPAQAHWGPLPELLPMLLDLPEPVAAVVVRVDETGGEILLARSGGTPEPTEQVSGRGPVHKVSTGGLSELNVQEHVEETWRRNVAELAARVDAHVSATAARVVVLAGDAPSRSRLRDALSERAAGIAVDLEHGGDGGGGGTGDDDLAAAVAEAVLDVVDAERHAVLEHYEQAAGKQEGYAVDGLESVVAALRAEQVDTLLIDGSVARDAELFYAAAAPTQVARDAEQLRAIGAEPHGPAPADAVLVRAAVGADAVFHPLGGGRTGLVGHDVADGVAALLRYPFVGT